MSDNSSGSESPSNASVSGSVESTDTMLKEGLELLKNAIVNSKPPYIAGTLHVNPEDLILYYGKEEHESLGRIDFSDVTAAKLEHLFNICDKATFGRGQEDVLDESYRKAAKLDPAYFATKLDLERLGLMDFVHYNLLSGVDSRRPIRAELYKLNVYGKDSFFKLHKDTPRSTQMFGSLVIVLPTPHEGGALILRHNDKEWTFDSGKEITTSSDPTVIAYASFFSDVEHEVTPVKSGHRVTLTYNLYYDDKATSNALDLSKPLPLNEFAVKNSLRTLLEDDKFCPKGVYLGFGLSHEYPIEIKPKKVSTLTYIAQNLKGIDALLMKACKEFKLDARLFFSYDAQDYEVITPDTTELEGSSVIVFKDEENDFSDYKYWIHEDMKIINAERYYENEIDFRVHWVTERTNFNELKFPDSAFGNDASIHLTYGQFCLVVKIGRAGKRATAKETE